MATPNQIVEVRSMIADLRSLARAVGGEISGRQVLALGLGHRPQDRSLSIRIEPGAPDGFIVYSFAGDDPFACKDYVRERLGLPEWEPGDEQDRRVEPLRRARFDRTTIDREATKRPRTPRFTKKQWSERARPTPALLSVLSCNFRQLMTLL